MNGPSFSAEHGDPGHSTSQEMPHNFEAEKALLGALIAYPKAYEMAAGSLEPKHFVDPVHGEIFAKACSLYEESGACSYVALLDKFSGHTHVDSAYLANIAGSMVTVTNSAHYATIIRKCHSQRLLLDLGEWVIDGARGGGSDLRAHIEEIETALFDIGDGINPGSGAPAGARSLAECLDEGLKEAEEALKAGGAAGIATGLEDLDRVVGGLMPGDFVVLAGATSMGKTALGFQIARTAAKAGNTVYKASLEMTGSQLAMRAIVERTAIAPSDVRAGRIDEDDMDKLIKHAAPLKELPIYIDDRPALTLPAIRSQAQRIKRRHGLGLVVVDYLQLMEGQGENRTQEVTKITRGLKNLAKELAVPVLGLAQLSRAVDQRDDHRPRLSDLRESGSIEQDADSIILIYRRAYYLERQTPEPKAGETDGEFTVRLGTHQARLERVKNLAELIVAKNRHGPIQTVRAHFDGPSMKFSNYINVPGAAR